MTTIVTRNNKGSELLYAEGDGNISRDIKTAAADPAPIDITDNRTVYECTGTFDFTLVAAATLITPTALAFADDFEITIKNVGAGTVTVKTTNPDTLDGVAATGDKAIAAGEALTYKVNSGADGWIAIAGTSSVNAITSDAVVADDMLVKGDGTARKIQKTGITVSDTTDNMNTNGGSITASGGFVGNLTGLASSATLAADAVSAGTLSATLVIGKGGTGATTHTANGVLLGQGGSAITATAAGTAKQVLLSGGAGVDPGWANRTMIISGGVGANFSSTGFNVFYSFNGFGANTTEADVGFISPITGTIKDLRVFLPSNAADNDIVFTVRNTTTTTNGATVTYTGGTQTGIKSDLSTTLTVTAGDKINMNLDMSAASAGSNIVSATNWSVTIYE